MNADSPRERAAIPLSSHDCRYAVPGMEPLRTIELSDEEARNLRGVVQLRGGELIEDGIVMGVQQHANTAPIEQWALDNPGGIRIGYETSVRGVDIGASCAWSRLSSLSPATPPLYALVIDSGPAEIEALHGVFSLPPDAPGGEHGIDLLDSDEEPFVSRNLPGALGRQTSSPFHGTTSSGLIAARPASPLGLSGALGPLSGSRFFLAAARVLGERPNGESIGSFKDVLCAMNYGAALARWMRAAPGRGKLVAVNLSLTLDCPAPGSATCPSREQEQGFNQAAAALAAQEVIVVAATGNSAFDGGRCSPQFPSSSNAPNVLAVGGVTPAGQSAYCMGSQWVSVAAPAVHVSAPDGSGAVTDCCGTSCAAPLATAVVMMTAAMHPTLGATELRARIINSALPVSGLDGAVSVGVVNACRAINYPVR